MAVGAVVVVQEDLLERRLAARQGLDRVPGERGDQRADAARDLEAQRVGAGARRPARPRRWQLGRRAGEGDLDGLRAEVAQLLQRPLVDQPPVPEDPDAVADRLDLAEDVRGQEDRLPARLGLLDAFAERHLHQRVEPARRLVEQQQVRARRERRDQLDLLAVALRERADLLAGVELRSARPARRGRRRRRRRAGGPRNSNVSALVIDGHRNGSPATYATRRWAVTGSLQASTPKSSARPLLGRCRPSRSRIVVVLPAPLGPR